MNDLLVALALAAALEGIAYALFPDGMKSMIAIVMKQPIANLRVAGLSVATLAVGFIWLIRG